MKTQPLVVLAVIYSAMLIYASIMPFDIGSVDDLEKSLSRFWGGWPIDPEARISGSDVMSNLVLYIPLGWFVAVRCKFSRDKPIVVVLIASAMCSVLSLCIEFVQMFTVSRISSAADWLFNSVSGFFGAITGVLYGEKVWLKGVSWLEKSWCDRPANIVAMMLIVLLAADAWAPYMPTILTKQVWRSLKNSHFNIMEGLALHPWHWWLVTRVLVYMVLTMLLASWGGRKDEGVTISWVRAAVVTACFALVFETGKLFIASRSMNVANIITSWIGGFLGILIGVFSSNKLISNKLNVMIVTLLVYVFYLWWTPFNFVWEPEMIQSGLPSPIQLLPLYHYAMGAELNHIRLFVQSIFLLGLFTYLIRLKFGWIERRVSVILIAVLLAMALGLLLEGGQLLLPSRTASMTDVYCFAAGAGIGAWVPLPQSKYDTSG